MINVRLAVWVGMLALIMLTGCTAKPATIPWPDYWPTGGWRTALPAEHGFDPALPDRIADRVEQELPFLDGLLIIRHGMIVHESYYNGYDADALHDIASVTKSWTSALVGLAQRDGKLTDLDAPLSTLLPTYFATGDHADKAGITLRHLLMMRSGIDFDEDTLNTGGYGGEELLEGDLTALALDFPVAYASGEAWIYSTLDSQLLSAVVQAAVGIPLAEYARSTLFASLGIGPTEWWADGLGTTVGGQNLSMTPRDMAKLGLLYLHNGVWEGEQLLPAAWVQASLTPQQTAYFPVTGQNETIEWYGYHWWVWKGDWFFGYRSFQAAGFAGQQVLVFPELDLMLVTTSNLAGVDPEGDIEQRTKLNEMLIKDVIFPTLTDVDLAP